MDDRNNPWLTEYWRHQYIDCPMRSEGVSCDADIQTRTRNFRLGNNVQETLVAIETFAHALKDAHADLCGRTSGMCAALREMTSEHWTKYLASVSFSSQDGVRVSRQKSGRFTQMSFDVLNVQLDGTSYRPVEVRTWSDRTKKLICDLVRVF